MQRMMADMGAMMATPLPGPDQIMQAAMRGMSQVAAGSSVQVPLFVTPVLVFVGFGLALLTPGLQQFTLVFKPLELVTVGLVVFVYALVNLDGETTWLEGLQLCAFYAMIALTALYVVLSSRRASRASCASCTHPSSTSWSSRRRT